MNGDQRCENCGYGRPTASGRVSCRRRSPTVVVVRDRIVATDVTEVPIPWTLWPEIAPDEWCGDYEPTEYPPVAPDADLHNVECPAARAAYAEDVAHATEAAPARSKGFTPRQNDEAEVARANAPFLAGQVENSGGSCVTCDVCGWIEIHNEVGDLDDDSHAPGCPRRAVPICQEGECDGD